ncbi:MAG: TRL-like family protein [Marinilabilia sp.]
MFKKLTKFFAVIFMAALLSSCTLTLPVTATSNPVGEKVGTAKATGFFGILFFDADASIQKAAENGGITKISTVDIKHTNVLGIVWGYQTIVTGE